MTIVKSDGCTTRLCPTFDRNEATEEKKGCGRGREILPFGMRGRDKGSKRGTMEGDIAAEASAGQ